jgi:redox-sensitive bicupin YhaK (pirin superfamily)
MITIRPADERGATRLDWLDSRHSFSFGDYHDPRHESFRDLRVLNDDRIAPGAGFGMHPHRDFEIISYVAAGKLAHRDSLGNGSVIHPGEVQRMTAGTGIRHSEFNPSDSEPTHLLQVWIVPERRGLEPSYEQKAFPQPERLGRWRLLASRDGRDGSVTIHQDAAMYGTVLDAGHSIRHELRSGRHAWLQVVHGEFTLNDRPMKTGDGAAISDESTLVLSAGTPSEVLLFDLA